MNSVAVKLCECGCGQPAPLAVNDDKKYGIKKGEPRRFIHNHHHKLKPGKVWKHGLTQHHYAKRNATIQNLAASVLGEKTMTLDRFAKLVHEKWPDVTTWGVSRICTTAGVKDNVKRLRPTPFAPLLSDAALLARSMSKEYDDLSARAFRLAQSMSYQKSAEMVGPIWEGMAEAWERGEREDEALNAAGRAALKSHWNEVATHRVASLDAMQEAWRFEAETVPIDDVVPEAVMPSPPSRFTPYRKALDPRSPRTTWHTRDSTRLAYLRKYRAARRAYVYVCPYCGGSEHAQPPEGDDPVCIIVGWGVRQPRIAARVMTRMDYDAPRPASTKGGG